MNSYLPIDSRRLIELQLELECVTVLAGNTLAPMIPCPNSDGPARFLVAYHDGGHSTFFHRDLPAPIRTELTALPPDVAFADHTRVRAILAQDAPCDAMTPFTAYVLPESLNAALAPDAVRLDDEQHHALMDRRQPGWRVGEATVYAVMADGQIVATCSSSRENDRCAEAWVETDPAYRRRGYARQVTTAWARDLQRQGKLPFYSHLAENVASQAVARSLGLISFVDAVAYD